MKYRYIIIGGGSAGCVLANRLSHSGKETVCLIEAGPDTPPEKMPQSIYGDSFLPDYFKPNRYWTDLIAYADPIGNRSPREVEAEMKPRRYEQARVMGGGSTVNGQVAIRGLPSDYDEWERLGAQGWSYADCLPFFQKLENDVDYPDASTSRPGPIPIRRTFPKHWSRFALSMRDAVGAKGIPYVDDCHQNPIDSCFPFTRNNLYDHRVSSASGYLDEATRARKNLTILSDCFVKSIEFDGKVARGVQVRRAANVVESLEAEEIIISAGALHSPAILMRSGIGPADHLAEMGIPVRANRPGVGQNLQDHPLIGFAVHLKPPGMMQDYVKSNLLMHMRWSSGHDGCPPTDMKLTVSGRFAWSELGKRLAMVNFGPNKAFSRGMVKLRSASPDEHPFIAFNYLSDQRDLQRMKATAIWLSKILMSQPVSTVVHSFWPGIYADSIRNLAAKTWVNGAKTRLAASFLDHGGIARSFILGKAVDKRFPLDRVLTDETVLEAWLRAGVQGDWHACGTCRMGNERDAGAVVDASGKVYGVQGLRVIDASVMPSVPCATTNLTTMMIAEKMAHQTLTADKVAV
ncbi:GMC family oxidoreductase N-terminal domain-containing protein [Mesorhizobium sp. M0751]|uniref:GMC family oxidoreductase n=1 Tax=unclassified Mesorhizobium TaxID=325217 RepID=UPI00333BCCC7